LGNHRVGDWIRDPKEVRRSAGNWICKGTANDLVRSTNGCSRTAQSARRCEGQDRRIPLQESAENTAAEGEGEVTRCPKATDADGSAFFVGDNPARSIGRDQVAPVRMRKRIGCIRAQSGRYDLRSGEGD
jgi:hypothetical protein